MAIIPTSPHEQQYISRVQRAVLSGGGKWVGIQPALDPSQYDECLFTHPTTGDLLSIPVPFMLGFSDAEFSKTVHEMLEKSDKAAGERRVSIKVSALRDLSQRAQFVVDELNRIIEVKS